MALNKRISWGYPLAMLEPPMTPEGHIFTRLFSGKRPRPEISMMASRGTPCQSSALSFETENPWNVVILSGIFSRFWERFHLDLQKIGSIFRLFVLKPWFFLRRLTPSRILQQFFADVRQLARPLGGKGWTPPVHRILSPTKMAIKWQSDHVLESLDSLFGKFCLGVWCCFKDVSIHFIFSKTVSFFSHFLGWAIWGCRVELLFLMKTVATSHGPKIWIIHSIIPWYFAIHHVFFCVSLPGKKLKIFFPGGWKNLCCQPVTSNYDPSFRSSDGLTRTGGTEVYSQEMIDEADMNNVNNGQSAIGFACGFRPSQFSHLVAIIYNMIYNDILWYIMIYYDIYIHINIQYIYIYISKGPCTCTNCLLQRPSVLL